jgi:serine/threonine protein kinase
MIYEKDTLVPEEGRKCVLKSANQTAFSSLVTDLPADMHREAELLQEIYGINNAGVLCIREENSSQPVIFMPFLAELNLESLLANKAQIHMIPCQEWLSLFMILCAKLDFIHSKTANIHSDLKPANVGITLEEGPQGHYFKTVNFFDLGNAHPSDVAGRMSHPKYTPPDAFLLGSFIPVKNKTTDIYGLGKIFFDLLNILIVSAPQNSVEHQAYKEVEKLLAKMTSLYEAERPSLKEIFLQIQMLSKMYLAHAKESMVHELSDLHEYEENLERYTFQGKAFLASLHDSVHDKKWDNDTADFFGNKRTNTHILALRAILSTCNQRLRNIDVLTMIHQVEKYTDTIPAANTPLGNLKQDILRTLKNLETVDPGSKLRLEV